MEGRGRSGRGVLRNGREWGRWCGEGWGISIDLACRSVHDVEEQENYTSGVGLTQSRLTALAVEESTGGAGIEKLRWHNETRDGTMGVMPVLLLPLLPLLP